MKILPKLKKIPGRMMSSALIATGINKVTDKDSKERLEEIEKHAEHLNKLYEKCEKTISDLHENGIKIPGRENSEPTFEEKMEFLAHLRKEVNRFLLFEFNQGSVFAKEDFKKDLPESMVKKYGDYIYKPLEKMKELKNFGLLPEDRNKAREKISSFEDQTRKKALFDSISKLEKDVINDRFEKGRATTSDLSEKLKELIVLTRDHLNSELKHLQAYGNNYDTKEVEENIMKSMSSLNLTDKNNQNLAASAKENPKVNFLKRIKKALTKNPRKNKTSNRIS